ncbi:unnamed protein product [Laminaria digitata]
MRASLLRSLGCCLPLGNLAFQGSAHLTVKSANTVWTVVPAASCSCRITGPSIERPWRPTSSSGSSERGQRQMYDPLASAVNADAADEQSGWADDCELDSQGKVMLKGLLFSETERLMDRLGEKRGRAEVLAGWLYHDRRLVRDVADTGGEDGDHSRRMGKKTRERVGAISTADGGLRLEDVQSAADGTRKLVSVLTSGEGAGKKVETVIIPMLRGPQREPRYTVCVSSQVGCAMNCQFCYTGRLGLMANLQTAQIVEQVVSAKRFLESVGDPAKVTGVVFMGMGEPFDNYDRVMRAVNILTDPVAGVRLKASSVTVSTVGLVPEIERFCTDPGNGASLAISLHAVTDEVRDKLIPVNRRYPLAQLSETLRTHFPRPSKPKPDDCKDTSSAGSDETSTGNVASLTTSPSLPGATAGGQGAAAAGAAQIRPSDRKPGQRPRRKSRILSVEYTLLGGVNDSLADADRLANWLKGVACVVNLITFNAHSGTPFSVSSLATSEAFRQALSESGQLCTFRDSRGDDEMAACGQLGGKSMAGPDARKTLPVTWVPDNVIRAGSSA